jgi:hypothetical protein
MTSQSNVSFASGDREANVTCNTDRFLDHNPRPLSVTRQSGLAEVLWDFAEHPRRCGHVEDAVDPSRLEFHEAQH